MDVKTHLKVSAINFAFLLTGLLLGPAIVHSDSFLRIVHAQTKDGAKDKGSPAVAKEAATPLPSVQPECEHAECIATAVGMPSAAIGTLLAGRMATDSIMVNGFDLLKLHDGVLVALQRKGLLSQSDVETILKNAKVEKPLRVKPPSQ